MAQNATKLSELLQTFSHNLNPSDSEDQSILASISKLKSSNTFEGDLSEFSGRIALLLKHDWERAKHEAKPWFFRWKSPKRCPFFR
jgi:hypothetical protein